MSINRSRITFVLAEYSENNNVLHNILAYLNLVRHYTVFFIRYNGPILLKRVVENSLKVLVKLAALGLLQILFTTNMFVVSIYYPKTVRDNLDYLRSKPILNKMQLKKLNFILARPHTSLDDLKINLINELEYMCIAEKDIRLIIKILDDLYEQYGINNNTLSNPLWNVSLRDTLTKNVTRIEYLNPALVHFLGIQQEYNTPVFIKPSEVQEPFIKPIKLLLGLLLIIENITVTTMLVQNKKINRLIVAFYFAILAFFFVFGETIQKTLSMPSFGAFREFHHLTIGNFLSLMGLGLHGLWCIFLISCALYLIYDTYHCFIPTGIKILSLLDLIKVRRVRDNQLMPYPSLTNHFKTKYHRLLSDSCVGANYYLNALQSFRGGNKSSRQFLSSEWFFTIRPVYDAASGVTVAVIILTIVRRLLSISDLIESMYLSLQDSEESLNYLEGTYLDPENYFIQNYDHSIFWFSFVSALNIAKLVVVTAPNMLLHYLVSPTQFYYMTFRPCFALLIPYLYLLWTRRPNVDQILLDKTQKQKKAMQLVLFIVSFVVFIQPFFTDVYAFFRPMYLKFYFRSNLLKVVPYRPYFNGHLVDYLAYYLNDISFNELAPMRDQKSDLYRNL